MFRPACRALVRAGGRLGALHPTSGQWATSHPPSAASAKGRAAKAAAEAMGISSAALAQQQQQQQQREHRRARPPVLSSGASRRAHPSAVPKAAAALITPPRAPAARSRAQQPAVAEDDAVEEAEEAFSVDDVVADAMRGRRAARGLQQQQHGDGRDAGSPGLRSVIDDPELAALVAAHKARHGSVTPPPPQVPSSPLSAPASAPLAPRPSRKRKAEGQQTAVPVADGGALEADGDDLFCSFGARAGGPPVEEVLGFVEEVTEADMGDDIDEPAASFFPKKPSRRAATRERAEADGAAEEWEEEADRDEPRRRGHTAPTAIAAASREQRTKARKKATKAAAALVDVPEIDPSPVEEGAAAAASPAVPSASAIRSTDSAVTGDATLSVLTNPFRGIHNCLARSYRLDQLVDTAAVGDALLARQEKKSGAFSFLKFTAGKDLYEGHWASLADLQSMHQRQVFPGGFKSGTVTDMYARLRQGGIAVPGFSLFNNNLGLYNARVTSSFPLLLAQRLLLFPDSMRHFHALCGRENVPCDFFADVDLPDVSPQEGEKVLLEILNYLEVRLPGVGFTDPFFLVLTNAEPSKDKVSYHIHARSMTYRQEEAGLVLGKQGAKAAGKTAKKSTRKGKKGAGSGAGEEVFDDMGLREEAEDDDLTDLVNVVDGGKAGKPVSTPRVIAFQDYRTVKLLGDEVNQTVGKLVIDDNCYRLHGMLRCAFSAKLPSSQDHDHRLVSTAAASRKRLVPLVKASDSALQQRLTHMEAVLRTMTDPEILEMTFCNRYLDDAEASKLVQQHLTATLPARPRTPEERQDKDAALRTAHKHRFKLLRPRHILGPQSAQAAEYDAYGNLVSPFLTEAAKWKRYNHVVQKLRTLPPRAAETYDVWVRIGLALHNFSNEDHVFEEWVRFSLKSPQKYSREVCRKKWMQFERNPDALNWRRGFNYLNTTVWRQV